MNEHTHIPLSVANPEKPIDFKGCLADFAQPVLCAVVARRYEGTGPIRLILHEAHVTPEGGFGYGHARHWNVGIGTLLGGINSESRKEAARINGKKGGRKPNTRLETKHSVSTARSPKNFTPTVAGINATPTPRPRHSKTHRK